VQVPALIHTDGTRLLVLERLDAQPLDTAWARARDRLHAAAWKRRA